VSRKLRPDETHLWGHVTATVRPLPGRATPAPPPVARPESGTPDAPARVPVAAAAAAKPKPKAVRAPEAIEPGRKRRIVRGHEPLEARIDLHGMTYDRARAALEAFLLRAWDEGAREALVITGKGSRGEGLLRRHAPEWLAAPPLRAIVAGLSPADRRHGGDGALYVALKRKQKT
jgi:DNA-nicking Smr family endonuclease